MWMLCVKGLHDQGLNMHLSAVMYRLLRDRGTLEDVQLFTRYTAVKHDEIFKFPLAQHVRSEWPVPVIKAEKDPKALTVDYLIKEYEAMSVEETSEPTEGTTLPKQTSAPS